MYSKKRGIIGNRKNTKLGKLKKHVENASSKKFEVNRFIKKNKQERVYFLEIRREKKIWIIRFNSRCLNKTRKL